jgi:hypothetical protein
MDRRDRTSTTTSTLLIVQLGEVDGLGFGHRLRDACGRF